MTLDGTIIHKSGLITGGRSTHGSEKKWDEKDVQGLQKSRDSLLSKLRDLSKQKPRGKTDENLIAEISQLESNITIARDELVCYDPLHSLRLLKTLLSLECLQNTAHWSQGRAETPRTGDSEEWA